MLRIRQWILGVLMLVCSSLQAQEFNQNYYYTPDELPNACIYLPAPPAFDSQVFEDDFQQWIWGKSVRDTERGKMASKDSELTFQKMAKIYGEILGFTIGEKETPAIWKFMVRAGDTGHAAVKKAKERYMRVRPFALMNENLAGEFDVDSALRKNGSYPSGHTATGWSIALALAEMAPEMQDALLRRGYQYGESRVIVGAHWQSDVEAARLTSAAALASMHHHPNYLKDLKEARSEFLKITGLKMNNIAYPKVENIIDLPLDTNNRRYYSDFVQYQQALAERNTPRGKQAYEDADVSDEAFLKCFSPAIGISLSASETPHIAALLVRTKQILMEEATRLQATTFRKRPWEQYGEAVPMVATAENLKSTSYPSVGATLGWGLSLVLVEVASSRQDDILARGYEFGRSRVITGMNFASDVHAGRLLATCVFVRMQSDRDFQTLLEKAQKEYEKLRVK